MLLFNLCCVVLIVISVANCSYKSFSNSGPGPSRATVSIVGDIGAYSRLPTWFVVPLSGFGGTREGSVPERSLFQIGKKRRFFRLQKNRVFRLPKKIFCQSKKKRVFRSPRKGDFSASEKSLFQVPEKAIFFGTIKTAF